MKTFKNIFDFQAHFNTEEKCKEELEQQRWGNTPACPCCGSANVVRFTANNRIFYAVKKNVVRNSVSPLAQYIRTQKYLFKNGF
jgi:hypothetical protein